MRCSPALLRPGFWRNSLDELKRLSHIAVTFQALRVPEKPWDLLTFDDPSSLELCKSMSDADIGGFSTAQLDHVPKSSSEPAHMRFHGAISTQLPSGKPEVQRTGYAGWRTLDRGWSMFGKTNWDIDPYTYLALRVKSDGRKYFVNIQSETIVPTDLHQHRLYTKTPGQWETVLIDFQDFVRTNHGMVVEPQSELLRQKVVSVGISSTDRMPGPFDLAISRIWATNRLDQGDRLERENVKNFSAPKKEPAQFSTET